MKYTTFQSIILIKNSLDIMKRNEIVKDIKNFIERYTKKIDIIDQNTRALAYKIEDYEDAWFLAIEFKLKSIGANKRVRIIKEKLNTIAEILNYKIVEKDKEKIEDSNNQIFYIVYEFDYGDISKGIEPRVTHFGGFNTREKAVVQANELLNEGLEKYFIESNLANIENPFKDYDEVHLFEKKTEEEQDKNVYYIKIEKINLN